MEGQEEKMEEEAEKRGRRGKEKNKTMWKGSETEGK